MSTVTTFCENCRKDVFFSLKEESTVQSFKREDVLFTKTSAFCEECGNSVFVAELHDANLKALYDVYRLKNEIISLENICEIPVRYSIGKRPLSRLLGWGELTFTRYCDGDVPTKQYADILKHIYDEPNYFLSILENNKSILSSSSYRKSKSAAQSLLKKKTEYKSKLENTVRYILEQCDDITNLALQKSLYYVQGFYYAFHNNFIFEEDCEAWIHGPVYKEIYQHYSNYGFNSIATPYERSNHIFSTQEQALIDCIVKYFCCYSGKTLEKFTHIETPWLETRGDLPSNVQSARIISKDLIASYFTSVKEKYCMLNPSDTKTYSSEMFKKL